MRSEYLDLHRLHAAARELASKLHPLDVSASRWPRPAHLQRLRQHSHVVTQAYRAVAEDVHARRARVTGSGVAARQRPPHRQRSGQRAQGPAAGLLPPAAEGARPHVERGRPRRSDGADAGRSERRPPRHRAHARLRHCVPVDRAADHRRAVGVAEHPQGSARRSPRGPVGRYPGHPSGHRAGRPLPGRRRGVGRRRAAGARRRRDPAVRDPPAAAHPRIRPAHDAAARQSRGPPGDVAADLGRGDPGRRAAGGGRPGVDGQRHHQPALLRHQRLAPLLRNHQSGGGDPPPRPGRGLRPDGLRQPRPLPPVARGAGRRDRGGPERRRPALRRPGASKRRRQRRSATGARRLLPHRARPSHARAQSRSSTDAAPPPGALLLHPCDLDLPAADRRGHDVAGGGRRRLRRIRRWLARDPAVGGAGGAAAGERPRHRHRAARAERAGQAAAAAAHRSRRGTAARGADDGHRPDPLRQCRDRGAHGRAPRGGGVRQSGSVPPLRPAQRLHRCQGRAPARGRRHPGSRPRRHRPAQRPPRQRPHRSLLSVPPGPPLESEGRPVDGMGAQARQDRGVQPPAARRRRHQLWPLRGRPVGAAAGALLHHPRQRHAAAA